MILCLKITIANYLDKKKFNQQLKKGLRRSLNTNICNRDADVNLGISRENENNRNSRYRNRNNEETNFNNTSSYNNYNDSTINMWLNVMEHNSNRRNTQQTSYTNLENIVNI